MKRLAFILSLSFTVVIAVQCRNINSHNADTLSIANQSVTAQTIINPQGSTIETRFSTPDGFARIPVALHSFADYLRHLPLKTAGSKVKYYNGREKDDYAYAAVIKMDIGNQNLQQCADAVMRLRGEYFYEEKKYDSISFVLTNGFKADYKEWTEGNRIKVSGNETIWTKTNAPSNTYQDFRNYMDVVFAYAGTLSLSKTLHSKTIKDIAIGDVFIVGGSPGHAVIVVDVVQNKSGEKLFMLAQSYMPAQETQVLRNLNEETISPWYRSDFAGDLVTPEWTFTRSQLKTW